MTVHIRRLFRVMLLGLELTGLCLIAVAAYLAWRINATGASDAAQQADVIVILGARVLPNGEPGPDLLERTLHGVALWEQELARTVVCTGGHASDPLSAAAVGCRLAAARGVPTASLLLADGAMTTREDAARTAELMRAHGWQTAILVSHPLHLERARRLFAREGLSVYTSPTSTALNDIPWGTRAWLTARETVGIMWTPLEAAGVPDAWTRVLSRWVYGRSS
jgi:uncharacterized SAM-binding protein YcdF (DUF218 family)